MSRDDDTQRGDGLSDSIWPLDHVLFNTGGFFFSMVGFDPPCQCLDYLEVGWKVRDLPMQTVENPRPTSSFGEGKQSRSNAVFHDTRSAR